MGRFLDGLAAPAAALDERGQGEPADALRSAVDELRACTEWLLEHRSEANDVLAGATPYARMFGIVAGGSLMAEALLAAPVGSDKEAVASFYLSQILPSAAGLAPSVTAGSTSLFSIEADSL